MNTTKGQTVADMKIGGDWFRTKKYGSRLFQRINENEYRLSNTKHEMFQRVAAIDSEHNLWAVASFEIVTEVQPRAVAAEKDFQRSPRLRDANLANTINIVVALRDNSPSFSYQDILAFLTELQERRAND